LITLTRLAQMKRDGEKIACLTAYDACFAGLLDAAGVEILLVGDTLGMVVQGRHSTLPVTLQDMAYHVACVTRGRRNGLIVADLPFMSYASPGQALESSAQLMRAGAEVVKLEGGAIQLETVRQLTARGIPVCGHLGLLPQSVHKLGGYKVQGRDPAAYRSIVDDARALAQAGADLLVLECVPPGLATEVCAAVSIPVIGIGAGAGCDGQVLVLYDMLGMATGRRPRFVQDFSAGATGIPDALRRYVRAVKDGSFPGPQHAYE
jgi:3-methyl-2-oxobutanoate hydroxymethyltransferase